MDTVTYPTRNTSRKQDCLRGHRFYLKNKISILFILHFVLLSCAPVLKTTEYHDTYIKTEEIPLEDFIKYEINYSFEGEEYFRNTTLNISCQIVHICKTEKKDYYKREKIIKNTSGDANFTIITKTILGILATGGGIYALLEAPNYSDKKDEYNPYEYDNKYDPNEPTPRESAEFWGTIAVSVGGLLVISSIIDGVRLIDTKKKLGIITRQEIIARECKRYAGSDLPVYISFDEKNKELIGKTDNFGRMTINLEKLGKNAARYQKPWAFLFIGTEVKEVILPYSLEEYLKAVQMAVSQKTIEGYENFIKKYPNSKHAEIFLNEINLMRVNERKELDNAISLSSIDALLKFIKSYPTSIYVNEAKQKVVELALNLAVQATQKRSYSEALEYYQLALEYASSEEQKYEIKKGLERALNSIPPSSIDVVIEFIESYPTSIYVNEAKQKVIELALILAVQATRKRSYSEALEYYQLALEYASSEEQKYEIERERKRVLESIPIKEIDTEELAYKIYPPTAEPIYLLLNPVSIRGRIVSFGALISKRFAEGYLVNIGQFVIYVRLINPNIEKKFVSNQPVTILAKVEGIFDLTTSRGIKTIPQVGAIWIESLY